MCANNSRAEHRARAHLGSRASLSRAPLRLTAGTFIYYVSFYRRNWWSAVDAMAVGVQQKPDDEIFRDVLASLHRNESRPGAHRGALERPATKQAARSNKVESEANQRRTEALLEQARRLSRLGTFTIDVEADEHDWSDELYRILEVQPGSEVGFEILRSRVHQDDRPDFDTAVAKSFGSGSVFDRIFRVTTPNGTIKHLRVVSHFVKGAADQALVIGSVQDVSESKNAEQALRASDAERKRAHAQLSEAQRLSKTGSFTSDLQLDEHTWSDECYRIFELCPGTRPRVEAVRARVHPDDLARFDAELQRGLAGSNADFTFRIVTPKVGLKYLRGVARVIEHVAGRPIFMGTVQDVTEAKLAEAALTSREADLRKAYSYLTEAQSLSKTGSFTWDVLGDEHNWSEEIRRIFGFGRDTKVTIEMIQRAIHPDDKAEVERVIGGAVEGRDFDITFRVLTSTGAVRHAHVVGHRIAHISDRPVFLGALQDVTESVVAEAALKGSEAELRRANSYLTIAQRLSKTGSFTWDPTTNESRWSDEMYRIFGLAGNGPVPTGLARKLVHPDDMPVIDALLRNARGGQDFDVEVRLVTSEGALKHVHIVGNQLDETSDHPVFVGAVQDVTDRKLAEEGLSRARSELAHVARATALSAVTASIAHEVNQPLAGIITNADTCLRMLALDPPNIEGAQATTQRTIRDGHRATEVVKRLRALFAGKPLGNERVDINDAAREILLLSSSELQRERVTLQTNFAVDLPIVIGDRVQLQQVILNLVLNAAQAMRSIHGRPRDLRVSTARCGSGQVVLAVCDLGAGTDAESLEQLFSAFYTTKPEGMGVGLSISRSIIEAHGGRLWASRNDGPGLTVSFSIPISSAAM